MNAVFACLYQNTVCQKRFLLLRRIAEIGLGRTLTWGASGIGNSRVSGIPKSVERIFRRSLASNLSDVCLSYAIIS